MQLDHMLLDTILVHPDTHQPLMVDWVQKTIDASNIGKYTAGFEDGVPFLLPKDSILSKKSRIHGIHDSRFDYLDHYQRDAEVFDYFQEFESKIDQAERIRLNEMIINRIPPGMTSILDVGCGNGWLSQAMVSETTTVISMDISSRNPVEALKRHPHPRHEALITDVYHLPLREGSIDCIVASEIMEHVPDPALFIEKLHFVLKPGGKLIITTPYDEQIEYHLCVHCNHPTPAHAHLHAFNEHNIVKLIPEDIRSWTWSTFSHRYMSKSRLYMVMKGLPFGAWNTVDRLANKIWRRPMRLMVEVVKD